MVEEKENSVATADTQEANVNSPLLMSREDADGPPVDDELLAELESAKSSYPTTDHQLTHPDANPPMAVAHFLPKISWEELAQQLRREALTSSSTRRAAVLLYELGRIYEMYLEQYEQALDAYQESYSRLPGLVPNIRALIRIHLRMGNHAAAVEVMETELSTVSSSEERMAILTDRALLKRHRLQDISGANSDLARALKMDPDDPVVMDSLLDIFRQQGEFFEQENMLRRKIRICEDPALRSAMLCQLARLREEHFNDHEDAAAINRTALNTHSSNMQALFALVRTARNSHDYPSLAKLHETLAELEEGPPAAAALWSAARMYRDQLRNSTLAIATLEKALKYMPEERGLIIELAEIYEREKKWPELAETLKQALRIEGKSSEAATLAHRLAQIYLLRLHDPDKAIEQLKLALSIAPDYVPVRRMLGRLLAKRELHQDLLELLQSELEFYKDPEHRAAIAFRIGDIYETRLGDLEKAVTAYEQSLAIKSGFRPSFRGLSRVYHALGRFEELVALYEKELESSPSRDEKLLLLRRIAEIWERKQPQADGAISCYERIVEMEPSNLLALRSLHRLYAQQNRWDDLIHLLRNEADYVLDRWRRVSLLLEAAEIQERKLHRSEEALAIYREVLDIAPSHQPALMAAGRLLALAERHEDILKLYQREIESTEDPHHRAWLQIKIARLLTEKLGQPQKAISAYKFALELLQTHPAPEPNNTLIQVAADQLLRLYLQCGAKPSELLIVHQLRASPITPAAQAYHQRRLGELYLAVDNRPLAIEHFKRSLVLGDDDDSAMMHLQRLYTEADDRQSLLNVYQQKISSTTNVTERLLWEMKLARLLGTADHDLERSVEAWERVLEILPRNPVIIRQLERQLIRLEKWDHLVSILESLREPCEDADFNLACLLEIAALKEDRLDDLTGAAHACFEILEKNALHPEALSTLERYYRQTGNSSGLLQVYSRLLKAAQSRSEQTIILCAMGAISGRLGNFDEAGRMYQMGHDMMPDSLPVLRGKFRVALANGNNPTMAATLEEEADVTFVQARRTGCLFDAGRMWHHLVSDEERAILDYQKVLETDPGHPGALTALTELFTHRQDWPALIDHLEHSANVADGPLLRQELLERAAVLRRTRLNDLAGARRNIEEALTQNAEDQHLLTFLAELCREAGDYQALLDVNQRLIKITSDQVFLKALHFEQGIIADEHLHLADEAIASFKQVLEFDEHDLGALSRLSELLVRERIWNEAAVFTERLIIRDDDRQRVKSHLLRLSDIYADGFKDLSKAVQICKRALSLDPGHLGATEKLAQYLEKMHDAQGLQAHIGQTMAVHRARLERDPLRLESYQALYKVFTWLKADDWRNVIEQLLAGLKPQQHAVHQSAHQKRLSKDTAAAHKIQITEEVLDQVLVHPVERGPLRAMFVDSYEVLRKIAPPVSIPKSLKGERITSSNFPLYASLLQRFKKMLGSVEFNSMVIEGGRDRLTVLDTNVPTLVIGRTLTKECSENEIAFLLARLVAHVRLGHVLYEQLFSMNILGESITAMIAATCKSYHAPTQAESMLAMASKIDKLLNKKTRRKLEAVSLDLYDKQLDPDLWIESMRSSDNRIALALTHQVETAVSLLCQEDEELAGTRKTIPATTSPGKKAQTEVGTQLRQMLSFIVSDDYLQLRSAMGIDGLEQPRTAKSK